MFKIRKLNLVRVNLKKILNGKFEHPCSALGDITDFKLQPRLRHRTQYHSQRQH